MAKPRTCSGSVRSVSFTVVVEAQEPIVQKEWKIVLQALGASIAGLQPGPTSHGLDQTSSS